MNFCRSFKKLKSLKLQIECVKALAKIMSVSAESVSKHMEVRIITLDGMLVLFSEINIIVDD